MQDKDVILMETVYSIKSEKLENMILSEFYDYLVKLLGYHPKDENIVCDCRYVRISDNIEDDFYTAYKERYPGISESGIAMQLCLRGPMVDRELPKNSVRILKGFVHNQSEEEKIGVVNK